MNRNQSQSITYTRYPLSSILIYNGLTIAHFLLGGMALIVGCKLTSWVVDFLGIVYLIFAFVQMYVIMPLTVCPNCVYYGLEDGRCTTGLNLIARRITGPGDSRAFAKRSQGLLCHNNLYFVALVFPIVALIPALIMNFSPGLLAAEIILIGLLTFRFFVIFRTIACVHCRAKTLCPNAIAMGLGAGKRVSTGSVK